jgi:phosphonate transport system permease protein
MAGLRLALPKLGYRSASQLFLLIAAASLLLADLNIVALDPWAEMRRLVAGFLTPDFLSVEVRSVVSQCWA